MPVVVQRKFSVDAGHRRVKTVTNWARRVREVAHDCRRGSDTYAEWIHGLARLVTALTARRYLPLYRRTAGSSGLT